MPKTAFPEIARQKSPHPAARLLLSLTMMGLLACSSGEGPTDVDQQPDTTPPAAVTDLAQYRGADTSAIVAWSLAGDDSLSGRATRYEVRYAEAPLTAANWAAASPVAGEPTAHPNPAKLMVTIEGLQAGPTYYVGVVAFDEVGNASGLSNIVALVAAAMRTLYVKADRTGDYPTIAEAIHAALPGDVVLVAPGRYTWSGQGTGDPGSALITVLRDQTDFTILGEGGAEATILDGESQGGVMLVYGGTTGPPESREWAGVVIDGFTFTRGRCRGVEGQPGETWAGGGIAIHLSDTVVRNCVFRANDALQGGGIWSGGQGATVFENCLVEGNFADLGGGIMLVNSEPVITIRGCIVRDNQADLAGGGIFAANVGAVIENTVFQRNKSLSKGGGVSLSQLHPGSELRGCTIVGNWANQGAALRAANNMTVRLSHCVLAFNQWGAAYSTDLNAGVEAGCSLVFGNQLGDAPPPLYLDLGGNLNLDPLFCTDGVSPGPTSPCLPQNRPGGDGCGLIGARAEGCTL